LAANALGIPTLRDASRATLEKSNLLPVLLRRANAPIVVGVIAQKFDPAGGVSFCTHDH
jgi:hypothetical protein